MVGQASCEHAKIRVEDLDEAVDFYTDIMGLSRVEGGEDDVSYLGCGYNENFDLAVEGGGTGLDHLAIRVREDTDFGDYERRLTERGLEWSRHDGEEPNVGRALRVDSPIGATIELVTVADKRYAHADEIRGGGRSGVTPLDIDHVTLSGAPIQPTAEFLRDALDLNISEVVGTSDEWKGAFTRAGTNHHDLGFLNLSERLPEEPFKLRHVAWTMANIEHMKQFIDTLAQAGYQLEVSIHRHYAGNNLAAYFWEPGGNRFEICAEMASLDPDAPTEFVKRNEGFTAWGGIITPDSYRDGS